MFKRLIFVVTGQINGIQALDKLYLAFLDLSRDTFGPQKPDNKANVNGQKQKSERAQSILIYVWTCLIARPKRAHNRMPHAQAANIKDAHNRVFVERGQIGHGRQRPINDPFECDAREQYCERGVQTKLRLLAVHRENGQRRSSD